MNATAQTRRKSERELGLFLRSRRENLQPESVGLPAGGRRRTPGLKRDEVAELADISVDWYIRLEQGRPVRPSRQTVDAIASALRLNPVERCHLFSLAGLSLPHDPGTESVSASARRMLELLNQPTYISGRRWDLLEWNTAADHIFEFSKLAPRHRNLLMAMFSTPRARDLFGSGWSREAKRMIAEFRPIYDVNGSDPAFVELIDEIKEISATFVKWWGEHHVQRGGSGQKTLVLPRVGLKKFDYNTMQLAENPDLRLTIYSAVGD